MFSPPQSRRKSPPMEQRLPELDSTPAANRRSRASSAETKARTYREGDICQGAPKPRKYLELDKLPEDMLHHIHSLIPLQDAAPVACVSRRFLRSWRCYSNLRLNIKTVGLTDNKSGGIEMRYITRVDQILHNYSANGMKMKILQIDLLHCHSVSASYLDRWLQIATKSEINELSLLLCSFMKEKYCFPCSILLDETTAASSIQSLCLTGCTFHPIETLGYFRRLKSLDLVSVHITEEGLQHLLSKSSGLERLQICSCSEIICLKIPCTLQKLKFLIVKTCKKIHVVEIGAPNLSTFHSSGFPLEISIRDPSELKDVSLSSFQPSRVLSYGRTMLPSIAPNVERLTLLSRGENVNTPICPDKFLHLKSMEIKLHRSGCSPMYDIFSVVFFLDASPALESFILRVESSIIPDCVAGDEVYVRSESAYRHDRLRQVNIMGFRSAKSLIKLVIHILESSPSLEALMLDTTRGYGRKPGDNTNKCTASGESGKCCWMSERDLEDANAAVEYAGRYIVGRVPSAVEFKVLWPCRQCYTGNQ